MLAKLRGAALLVRYIRRAVQESDGTARHLRGALRAQIAVAEATFLLMRRLERNCSCPRFVLSPLDFVACPPCEMQRRLVGVAWNPARHSTAQHQLCIEDIAEQLNVCGYVS